MKWFSSFLFILILISLIITIKSNNNKNNKENSKKTLFLRDENDGYCFNGMFFEKCSIYNIWKLTEEKNQENSFKLSLYYNRTNECLTSNSINNVTFLSKCTSTNNQIWNMIGNTTSGYYLTNYLNSCVHRNQTNYSILTKCEHSMLLTLQILDNEMIQRIKSPQFQIYDIILAKRYDLLVPFISKYPTSINIQNWDDQTPLHCAINYGNLEIIQLLLSSGADQSIKDRFGATPFLISCMSGSLDIMYEFIQRQANIQDTSYIGQTALWFAAYSGNQQMIKFLLKHHLDPNLARDDGITPLMVAASRGFHMIVKHLLNAGALIDIKDDDGNTALVNAAENGSYDVIKVLISHGANVNVMTINNFTPLIIASSHGYFDIVKLLVENGANVDLEHPDDITALMYASSGNYYNIASYLIEKGSNVNLVHTFGGTSLLEVSAIVSWTNETILIITELINAGADINPVDNDGVTPLIAASSTGNIPAINLFIEKGCNLNHRTNSGYSALHYAILGNHIEIIVKLLQSNADVNIIVKATNEYLENTDNNNNDNNNQDIKKQGMTPLLLAIESGNLSIVQSIIENSSNKCNVNKSDKNGITPLISAIQLQHFDIVKYLLKHKANPNDVYKDEHGVKHNLLFESILANKTELSNLLIDHGANVNYISQEDNNRSILWYVSSFGQLELVKKLVSYKANVTIADSKGINCLMISLLNHYDSITEFLLSQPKVNFNHIDEDGTNLLMIASGSGYLNIVKILLEKKLNISHCNNDGHNSLHFAYKGRSQLNYLRKSNLGDINTINQIISNYTQIIQLLIKNGINQNQQDYKGRLPVDFDIKLIK